MGMGKGRGRIASPPSAAPLRSRYSRFDNSSVQPALLLSCPLCHLPCPTLRQPPLDGSSGWAVTLCRRVADAVQRWIEPRRCGCCTLCPGAGGGQTRDEKLPAQPSDDPVTLPGFWSRAEEGRMPGAWDPRSQGINVLELHPKDTRSSTASGLEISLSIIACSIQYWALHSARYRPCPAQNFCMAQRAPELVTTDHHKDTPQTQRPWSSLRHTQGGTGRPPPRPRRRRRLAQCGRLSAGRANRDSRRVVVY